MSDPDDFTVAWICALRTEYVAACAFLDEEYPDIRAGSKNDNNIYKLGRSGEHRVVIVGLYLGKYGLTSAAGVARDVVRTFTNLRFGLMVGIGGGAPTSKHPTRLGDVVVSQPTDGHGGVIQYDYGKAIQKQDFVLTGHMNEPPPLLLSAIARLSGDHELNGHEIQANIKAALQRRPRLVKKYGRPAAELDRLYLSHIIHPQNSDGACSELCGRDPSDVVSREERSLDDDDPSIYYGLIASANSLMKDTVIRDSLARKHGVLCFEMEAAGLMNTFPFLVIRGICDYSDTHKNDVWQGYAAMTAAAYTKELLSKIVPENVLSATKLSETIKGIQTDVQSIKDDTKVMADYNRKQSEQFANSQEHACLQGFKTSTYEEFKERNPSRIKGTCLWVLEHPRFDRWRQNPNSDLLWISADPGCGKSVLAKALVEDSEFSVAEQATVCYFFFKDNEIQDNLATALCALLHQLFSKQPPLLSHAMSDWKKTGKKLPAETDTLWRIFENAATDSRAGQVVCVLDALDECREKDRRRLNNFLRQFYVSSSGGSRKAGALKFVVTSRPYDDQEQNFSRIPEIRLRGEDENEKIGKEINLVIEHRLKQLESELRLSESTWHRLKTKLLEMEHRTYLWFYLAIEEIQETYRNSLRPDEEVIETIPSSVHAAYEKILAKVTDGQRDHVRKVLGIILGARRPFSLQELAYALGIATAPETDDLEKAVVHSDMSNWIRRCCGLFVYCSGSRVYLIHQTAKEFLLTQETCRLQGWGGTFEVKAINHLLASICIPALCSKDFQRYIPEGDGSSQSYNEEDENAIATNVTGYVKHAFLSYCAEYWTGHMRESYDSLCDTPLRDRIDLLHDVNGKAFHAWFSVLWKALFPYHRVPVMTQTRLCSLTGHYHWLEQNLSYADGRLEECDEEGRTALYWSCYMGLQSTANVLIDNGADVNFPSGMALEAALFRGHEEIVQLLIDKGAEVNAQSRHALRIAISGGHEHIVRQLITNGADVNAYDSFDDTALEAASKGGHEQIVQLLIDKGADVNAQDDGFFGNALQAAIYGGHEQIVQLLIDNGAGVNAQGGYYGNALQAAAYRGYEKIVRLLIKKGAGVNARGGEYGTALQAASFGGHEQIVQLLIDNGADINAQGDGFFGNALQAAIYGGDEQIVQLLIDNGADVKAQGGHYSTALQAASYKGHKQIVQLLIDNGADVKAQGGHYGNALQAASERGHEQIVQLLIDKGVDVNAQGGYHGNALQAASFGGHEQIVQLLIDKGADVNAQGGFFGTALQAASKRGHEEIARLLVENGADESVLYEHSAAPVMPDQDSNTPQDSDTPQDDEVSQDSDTASDLPLA